MSSQDAQKYWLIYCNAYKTGNEKENKTVTETFDNDGKMLGYSVSKTNNGGNLELVKTIVDDITTQNFVRYGSSDKANVSARALKNEAKTGDLEVLVDEKSSRVRSIQNKDPLVDISGISYLYTCIDTTGFDQITINGITYKGDNLSKKDNIVTVNDNEGNKIAEVTINSDRRITKIATDFSENQAQVQIFLDKTGVPENIISADKTANDTSTKTQNEVSSTIQNGNSDYISSEIISILDSSDISTKKAKLMEMVTAYQKVYGSTESIKNATLPDDLFEKIAENIPPDGDTINIQSFINTNYSNQSNDVKTAIYESLNGLSEFNGDIRLACLSKALVSYELIKSSEIELTKENFEKTQQSIHLKLNFQEIANDFNEKFGINKDFTTNVISGLFKDWSIGEQGNLAYRFLDVKTSMKMQNEVSSEKKNDIYGMEIDEEEEPSVEPSQTKTTTKSSTEPTAIETQKTTTETITKTTATYKTYDPKKWAAEFLTLRNASDTKEKGYTNDPGVTLRRLRAELKYGNYSPEEKLLFAADIKSAYAEGLHRKYLDYGANKETKAHKDFIANEKALKEILPDMNVQYLYTGAGNYTVSNELQSSDSAFRNLYEAEDIYQTI